MAKIYQNNKGKDDKVIICNEGGSRSSKTWDFFHFLVLYCDQNRDTWNEIYILRDTLVNCRDFTLKEFIKCLQVIGVYDNKLLTTSPKPYYNLFGNHIFFRGLEDEANAEGYPSDIFFINEALETIKGSVDGIKMRCRKLGVMDWNPKYISHWAFDLEGQPNVFFTHTTYKNNKHLEKSIIREIESYEPTPENIERKTADPFRWKVYGLGERATSEEVIFKEWDEFDDIPKNYDLKIYGLDFGFTNDPSTLIEVYLGKYDIWCKELIYETGLTNQELAKKIKLVVDTNSYIICDSSEPKSIRELRIEEINVIPAVKGQDSIINGINKLKSKNIHIHRDSFNIKKEIRGYKFKKEKDGNILNVPIKCPDHSLDAIRYAATRFDI
jgi:phage terminase large subunit